MSGRASWPAPSASQQIIRGYVRLRRTGLRDRSALRAKSALGLGDSRLPHARHFQPGALFAMQHNRWDHALKVTADGKGLVGHAGAILLRKAADQLGLTAGLSAALLRKGAAPLLDRGTVLASLAVAIALGATSMSDIALLAHLAPVLGDAPSGSTVRRALDLADTWVFSSTCRCAVPVRTDQAAGSRPHGWSDYVSFTTESRDCSEVSTP